VKCVGNPNSLISGGFANPSWGGVTIGAWPIKVYYGDSKPGIDCGWESLHLG